MLEGMYSAAAGMAAQQQRLDAVAGDLANSSTNGYKHVRIAFRDLVYTEGSKGTTNGVLIGSGAAATTLGRSRTQGSLKTTDEPLDVALQGQGYLNVRLADGTRALTRDGALRIDGQGRIGTQYGATLDPQIRVPAGMQPGDIGIGSDGTVTARGTVLGRLSIVDVPAPTGLQGGEDNTFIPTRASGAPRAVEAGSVIVSQRALESSNVDLATAMTEMIDAQRSFQLGSKAIQYADQAMEIANGIKR